MKIPPFSRPKALLLVATLLVGGAALAQATPSLTIWPHPNLYYQLEGSPDATVAVSSLLPIATGNMLVGDRSQNGVETPLQAMFGYGFGQPGKFPRGAKILKATVQLRAAGSPSLVGNVSGMGPLYLQRNFWRNGQRAIAVGSPDATARAVGLPFYGNVTFDVTQIVQGFAVRGETSCGFMLRFLNLSNKNGRTDTLAFRPGILTLTYALPVAPTPVPTATPAPTATPLPTPIPTATPVPGPAKLQIVYGAAGASSIDLKIFDEATQTSRLLTTGGADSGSAFGAWSPDKKQIAFSRTVGSGRYDLYLINADGTDERRLTNTPDFDEIAPRWSPDSTRLVYQYDKLPLIPGSNLGTYSPDKGVYVLTVATGATQIVFSQQFPGKPDWSFDGTQIVCSGSDDNNRKGLFFVKPDGTFLQYMAVSQYQDLVTNPRFSPDGKTIAYTINHGHLFDIATQQERPLVRTSDNYTFQIGKNPSWTRDGQLVFQLGNIQAIDATSTFWRDFGFSGAFPEAR